MSEWMSIKNSLPDNDEEVLIFIPCYPGISIGVKCGNRITDLVPRFDHDNAVTHWMNLPEPPK